MKIYKVKVNGKLYEVELESVTEAPSTVPVKQTPAINVAPTSGTTLKAPMQGTILDVKVKIGDRVKKGQCLFILEAMKLENEIVSPADGVVNNLMALKGQTVNNQDVLAVIE